MKKRIISFILTLTLLFSFVSVYASAASGEEYISEVSLVYRDTLEEAKAAIAGTDWKLYEQDLNPKADYWFDNGVYLIYKTSTDVEDAITDLRVMDMYGGFSTSSYKEQLEASRQEYLKSASQLRIAADEFKALYEAGDEMAKIAYRQMNYYKDTDTNSLMGDFMLNIPSDNALVTVMMEGNAIVSSNLLALLAIGLSNVEDSLAERVAALYAVRDSLTDEVYYNDAVALNSELETLAAKIKRYDSLADKYQLYDDNMGEEEYQFVKDFATVSLLAESIQLGDVTLAGMLRAGNWTVQDIYPLVAAFSQGQMALIKMGAFELTLKHATPSDSVEALNEVVSEIEKDMTDENGNINPIDVYVGVDRSVFNGVFAMTNAAERQQAIAGETWGIRDAASSSKNFYIAAGVLAALDIVAWGCFAHALQHVPVTATFYKITYNTLVFTGVDAKGLAFSFTDLTTSTSVNAAGVWFWTAVGLALIAIGLSSISTWYNYYNPDYTVIPDNMVDVIETDIGDRYIKYTAAKVYNDPDGRNADFNAYQGKEWNALYYTKDASAGKCLTPKFAYSDNNSSIARRHQGISMFGESEAFNLISHAYDGKAPAVYVTIRYSTAKKAAADIPSVVGSMFSDGALYTLTALGGAAVGVGAVFAIGALKKKKEVPDT